MVNSNNKGAQLSVYVPTVECRMLEDMSNEYQMSTSNVITKAIEKMYPQAKMKVKFTDWAICAIANNRFDLLRYNPADADGVILIGTDFVEVPGANGTSSLIGKIGKENDYNSEADADVVKTWLEYKKVITTIKDGVSASTYIVHMIDSSTGEVFMETCDSIDSARAIANKFYDEHVIEVMKLGHPEGYNDHKFVDNIHYKDVYTLKFDGNVVLASITPV